MKLGFILNCLLLAVVTADSLNTDQNVDFAASNSDNSGTLTRVIKSVKIKYPLALLPGAIWSQFLTLLHSFIIEGTLNTKRC